jgi:nucleoside-diphosphate-sugar epimerase
VWIDDIAPFIVQLASKGGIYNLTDGCDVSFAELYEGLCNAMHKRQNPSLPRCLARTIAVTGDVLGRLTHKKMPFDSYTYKKMTSDLTFSCEKAMRDFNWKPTPILERVRAGGLRQGQA